MRTAKAATPDRWTPPILKVYRGPKSRTVAEIPPPEPSFTRWSIGGLTYKQLFFTDAQWVRLPEKDRPRHYGRIDHLGVWVTLALDEKGL